MGEVICTCGGGGGACNGGVAGGGGGGWTHYISSWKDEGKVVAWIVGKPQEGEDQEEAELRTLKELLRKGALNCDPSKISWEAQCVIRSLLLARDAIREEVEGMLVSMGWQPREVRG